MPAGVSWAVYLRHCSAAMLAMLAGSQTVHIIYKPLEDLDELVEKERRRLQYMVEATLDEKEEVDTSQ